LTAASLAKRLTKLLLMPSASTTAIPFEPRSGWLGMIAP
jgi:hypothetical protein